MTTAAHIAGPLGLSPQLLVELVEGPEDRCGGVEEDGEHSLHPQQKGEAEGKLFVVVTVTPIHKEVHDPQDEAAGVHGHTPHQGRLVQVQVSVADEGEDDVGRIVLQPPEHTWECWPKAGHSTGSATDPGHFDGVQQSSPTGEGSGGDGAVSGRAWIIELDVGGAEDDGSREADDGKVRAKGVENAIPPSRYKRRRDWNLSYKRRRHWKLPNGSLKRLPNSSMKPRRVRLKQVGQMNRHQLITPTSRVSSLVSQMGTRVESSCPMRRKRLQPEDELIVLLTVRQVTGCGAVCNLACFPPKVL